MTEAVQDHFSNIMQSYATDIIHCCMTDLNMAVYNHDTMVSTTLNVHQTLLLPLSPSLARMVGNSVASDPPTIILAGASIAALQCLLNIVYTGECTIDSDCTVNDLVLLIQDLGMSFVNFDQRMEEHEWPDKNNNFSKAVCGLSQIDSSIDTPSLGPTECSSSAKEFKCKTCDENQPSPLHLVYHKQVAHSDTSESITVFKCKFCNASFNRKDGLLAHMQGRHAIYTCTMCEEIFEGSCRKKGKSNPFSRFLDHNKEEHSEKASFSFNLRKNHIEEGEHKCPNCSKSFSTIANMYYHIATDHNTELKCVFCEYSVIKKSHALLEHLKTHTGEKTHICKYCGKSFTARKTWANHVKLHTGEKTHSCTQCDAKFVQLTSLLNHMKKHKKGGMVVNLLDDLMCKVCGRKFKHRKNLKRHEKIHGR